jgi:hypothetical protein
MTDEEADALDELEIIGDIVREKMAVRPLEPYNTGSG